MPLTTVIWDWNGTLADDVRVALQSVNDILARRGREPITLEQYYSYMDTPIRRFYENLFHPLPDDLFDTLMLEFNQGYRRHMTSTGLMEGAKEALGRFDADNRLSQPYRGAVPFQPSFRRGGVFPLDTGGGGFPGGGQGGNGLPVPAGTGNCPGGMCRHWGHAPRPGTSQGHRLPCLLTGSGPSEPRPAGERGGAGVPPSEGRRVLDCKTDNALKFDIRLGFRYNKQESIPPRRRARRI